MPYSTNTRITFARLRKVLRYDAQTGAFTWLVQLAPRGPVGSIAGWVSQNRVRIGVDGTEYLAHRLAWLYVKGRWPRHEIDHINRNSSDNRWCNLREATASENHCNTGLRSDNTSGVKGVHYRTDRGKWEARIKLHQKVYVLGQFPVFANAVRARAEALVLHGAFGTLH